MSKVPRNIRVDVENFEGCCAIDILCDFPVTHYDGDERIEKNITTLTDDEWYNLIYSSCAYNKTLVAFANAADGGMGNEGFNKGGCTPTKLAKWLRSKGEKVYTGASAVNPDSGNIITVYSWAPSKAFQKKINKFINKKKNQNAQSDRGSTAA